MIFGMLVAQEDLLRLNREKLTLRFKSSSTERKLAAKMGSYLSGLLYFLGVLEVSLLPVRPFLMTLGCGLLYLAKARVFEGP